PALVAVTGAVHRMRVEQLLRITDLRRIRVQQEVELVDRLVAILAFEVVARAHELLARIRRRGERRQREPDRDQGSAHLTSTGLSPATTSTRWVTAVSPTNSISTVLVREFTFTNVIVFDRFSWPGRPSMRTLTLSLSHRGMIVPGRSVSVTVTSGLSPSLIVRSSSTNDGSLRNLISTGSSTSASTIPESGTATAS